MTIAVDWDTKPLIKQIDLGSCQIVASILWDFYLKLGCHDIRKCFEIHVYNKFVCLVGLTKQLFFWQTQTFLVVTSDQVVHQFFLSALPGGTSSPSTSKGHSIMVVANFFFLLYLRIEQRYSSSKLIFSKWSEFNLLPFGNRDVPYTFKQIIEFVINDLH